MNQSYIPYQQLLAMLLADSPQAFQALDKKNKTVVLEALRQIEWWINEISKTTMNDPSLDFSHTNTLMVLKRSLYRQRLELKKALQDLSEAPISKEDK